MSKITTTDAIRYGGSLIVYLVAIYFGGGIITFVGVAMMGAGSGGPLGGGGNPLLLLLGLLIALAGYVIMIAGTLGIGYKVIADGVTMGVDNSSVARSLMEEAR